MEQIVGVDRQSVCYVADNRFKAAVLLGDGNNGIRSRLLEFGLDLLSGADTVCARRERQLDRAVLANLSGFAVDCTGVVRLNRRGVGEFAGAVRAGNLGIVLYKVGGVNADGLVGIECVNINWIDKIYTINLYRGSVFFCGNVTLGNRPLFNHFTGVGVCGEGDYTAVRLLGLRVDRGVVNLGGQIAVLISGAESKLIACRNLKVYGCSNILVRTDFAFRIGFGVSGSLFAVYFPLFNLIASLRHCMEGDFLILIDGYAISRHSLGLNFLTVDIIQRVFYGAVAGRSGGLGGVGSALGKFSVDGQIAGQFADGVSAVGLCRSFILSSIVYNPVLEMPAAVCACLQLNLAAAGNLGQIVHSFAVYGCNDRAMLHFRCGNRKCGTVGLERNLGILSDGEGIAAVSVELSCFNSLAVHLIGLARGGSIACLGRYRNLRIAGDAFAALERLGERLGGIVRINRLIACGQFTFQRQRVAVALEYGSQINILHANLNRERVGAVRRVRFAGRIAVCTAFRENPLLEVPAGVRRCGEVELCTAGNVNREVLEAFGAIFIRAFECTALLILNGSIQFGIGGLEVNQNRCRFCKGLDGNRALLLAALDFLAVIGPVIDSITCIRHSRQSNIGVCSKAGDCTAVIRLAGIETCGNDRRGTDRVLVCAFAEVLSLEGQDVSQAVYRVNAGDKGKFVVIVQRFLGLIGLARRNRVVAGRNVRRERYLVACGVDCGIAKVQSSNLISSHVFRVCRERKLILVFRVDLILCNAVLRGDNAQRNGTLNNGKLGFRNRLVFAVDISIQRVSADIQLIVRCQRLRILGTGNCILEGRVIDLLQTLRILTHAGERRRYRIAVGEAGDAVVILAVGERQLIAGHVLANENHLTFRVAHILKYIAARIIRGNRVSAVCGHDNILCNLAGFAVNLSRNRGREVRAANQEAERAGRDGGGSRRGTHFSVDVQRAVKLSSVVFLYILRRNRQLTLGRAFAVNRVDFGRVSGNAELLLGGVVEVEHIQSAAVSALVGRTSVFDAQRIGNAAGNLGPGTIVQLLPLIAYAVVLAAVRIFIVSVILNRCGCQRIRIDRQNRLIFLAVNHYRNIGIACRGLGAAGQRFAVNAVALLLSLVVVAGLNLIFILGIGRQVLIRVAEGVGAVIVTLTIGERHKCEFLAAGAIRKIVITVQLETGNDLVVGPGQGDGIIGGFRNILLKILRQRRRSLRLGYRIGNNRERLIAAAVVVAENAPVHAVAVWFCFDRHVLQRTGERTACGVDRHLAGRVFRTCHNACGYAACTCTGFGFDRGGVGVVFAVRGGEVDLLRDAGAAACRGEVNLSRITVISLGACTRCARIAGRITDRMRQHAARNGWQNAVILGDIFVVGQVDQTDRGFVRDGNGGGYFSVFACSVRNVGGILVNLHRDGIERHSVLAGGCLVGDGLLQRGGVLGLVGETGGKGGFCLNAADLNAEYREFLLKGDVCADRDGRGGAGAVLGALHARVGGGGLGIVAGQVIAVEQIGEVRR